MTRFFVFWVVLFAISANYDPALAASQDECAIWLCAPAGFSPAECRAPYRAMIKRVRDFKPPLPGWHSCAQDAEGGTSKDGYAAYVPYRNICTAWGDGNDKHSGECISWQTIDEHYVKGMRCVQMGGGDGDVWRHPEGCTKTVRYVEAFIDGVQIGETFYFVP